MARHNTGSGKSQTRKTYTSSELEALMATPPSVVLYLGAGASQFAGYRTFADFPVLLFNQTVRDAEQLPPLPDAAIRLLTEIKVALESQDGWTTHDRFLWRLNEYEHILNLNRSDPAIQPFLRDASRQLFDLWCCTQAAVNVMAQTTVRHYSSNRVVPAHQSDPTTYQNMKRAYSLYMKMAELNGASGCLPVFTTNYDMLIEDLCSEFHESSTTRQPLANGLLHVNEEGETWVPLTCDGKCTACSILQYFRLHGCASWFYAQPGDPNVYFHRKDAHTKPISNLCAMYPGLERERGAGPHGHGFRALYRMLQVCDLIVFIGFSFRDDDVMHVLLKALAERQGQLQLLIVDSTYTKHNVASRLEEAARRSTFPADVPEDTCIVAMKVRYGVDEGFDDRILTQCKQMLRKRRSK